MLRFAWGAIATIATVVAGGGVVATMHDAPISDPVAVVLVTSLDEAAADATVISELVEEPKIKLACKTVEPLFCEEGLLGGFDPSRPAGLVVCLKGRKPVGYAALPIRDVELVRETFDPFLESIEEIERGVFKIVGKNRGDKPAFVKPLGKWILVSDRSDVFPASLPNAEGAVAEILGGADIGLHLMVGNVPDHLKDEFLKKVKKGIAKHVEKELDGNARLDGFRRDVAEKLQAVIGSITTDTESVTLTAAFDRETTALRAMLKVVAKDGTEMADFLNTDAKQPTQFPGFRCPKASLVASGVRTCPLSPIVDWEPLFAEIGEKAHAEIDAKEADSEKNAGAKRFVDNLLTIAQNTIASGRRDGALVVVAKPDKKAIAAAGYLSDGYQLEETLGMAVDFIRAEHPEEAKKFELAELEPVDGVHLHKIAFDIPADAKDREKVVALFGERATILVGFGPEAVYAAVGRSAEEVLPHLIRGAAGDANGGRRGVISLSTIDLARLVAEYGETAKEREDAAKALTVLEKYEDADHLVLRVEAIENGRVATFDVQEGVVQLALAAAKAEHAEKE